VRLTNRAMRAVHFARFAQQCRLTASDAAALCMLADRAFTAGARACSQPGEATRRRMERAGEAFEAEAERLGFRVYWPGLRPALTRRIRGQVAQIQVPELP